MGSSDVEEASVTRKAKSAQETATKMGLRNVVIQSDLDKQATYSLDISVSAINISPACASAPADPHMVDACIRILMSWLFNGNRGGKVLAFR